MLQESNDVEPDLSLEGSPIAFINYFNNIDTDNSIKIFGNPNLKINKKIVIKDYLKDHRVFMTSVITALVFGGTWIIHDKDSIKTSFPTFLDIINDIKK